MAEAVATGAAARCALIPSIFILRSAGALRFIDEKVPGIEVPAGLIARAEAASDQQQECFEIACEMADHARSLPGAAGLHFISFRKDAGIAKLCQRLGIPPHRDEQHGDSLQSRSSTVTIGPSSRSASSASASTRPGARSSRSAASRRPLDRRGRRPGPDRGRRRHGRRQRGHPAGRPSRLLTSMLRTVPGAANLPICIDSSSAHRGARGRPRRLRGQAARQLRHRRGRPPRRDPAARGPARRGRDRPGQRRDGHPRDPAAAARHRPQDRLRRRRPRDPARGRGDRPAGHDRRGRHGGRDHDAHDDLA